MTPDSTRRPLVVVDAANVVGSVPDGWWRDRRRATERLRDELQDLASSGLRPLPGVPDWASRAPLDLVLVVEGRARSVDEVPGVRIVRAERAGDDAIVDLVAATDNPHRLVVTADRGLRGRVSVLGAHVVGPSAVRRTEAGGSSRKTNQ